MKIIFSRKGFDSGWGGWPSPILPDLRMGRAKQLHPRMADRCGGAIECVGMILGGWRYDDDDEGYYGIRVWLRRGDRARLGLKE